MESTVLQCLNHGPILDEFVEEQGLWRVAALSAADSGKLKVRLDVVLFSFHGRPHESLTCTEVTTQRLLCHSAKAASTWRERERCESGQPRRHDRDHRRDWEWHRIPRELADRLWI